MPVNNIKGLRLIHFLFWARRIEKTIDDVVYNFHIGFVGPKAENNFPFPKGSNFTELSFSRVLRRSKGKLIILIETDLTLGKDLEERKVIHQDLAQQVFEAIWELLFSKWHGYHFLEVKVNIGSEAPGSIHRYKDHPREDHR